MDLQGLWYVLIDIYRWPIHWQKCYLGGQNVGVYMLTVGDESANSVLTSTELTHIMLVCFLFLVNLQHMHSISIAFHPP